MYPLTPVDVLGITYSGGFDLNYQVAPLGTGSGPIMGPGRPGPDRAPAWVPSRTADPFGTSRKPKPSPSTTADPFGTVLPGTLKKTLGVIKDVAMLAALFYGGYLVYRAGKSVAIFISETLVRSVSPRESAPLWHILGDPSL